MLQVAVAYRPHKKLFIACYSKRHKTSSLNVKKPSNLNRNYYRNSIARLNYLVQYYVFHIITIIPPPAVQGNRKLSTGKGIAKNFRCSILNLQTLLECYKTPSNRVFTLRSFDDVGGWLVQNLVAQGADWRGCATHASPPLVEPPSFKTRKF